MLQPGDRIGRFEIQRRLGRGGMATVYVAHDPNLGRLVALKMFEGDLDGSNAAERFLREARAAAALNHPHIVTIHDFGEFASQPFIVMEYLQGDTLGTLIKRKEPLPLAERLRLLEEICLGVAYAHGFDVIHRDIKPANLLRERGTPGRLKILDFGIARTLGSSMSRGTALVGTPGYMAPEQISGGEIDRRADLFAIGVVAYELLSYTEAFSGDSLPAISHSVMHSEPVALTSLVPDIPIALAQVVERALKKDPADRYGDAAAMGADIARIRRQIAAEPWSEAPTVAVPRQSPSDPGSGPGLPGGRGSGSGRGSARPLGGPATPGTARPGRDEIHRHRRAQIEVSLTRGRTLMADGRPTEALDACMHALALDENDPGALELEHVIRLALARQQAIAYVAEARKELDHGQLTLAQESLESARALDADASEVRQLERDLRLARAEQEEARQRAENVRKMLESASAALQRGELETALALARQALRLEPASDLAREMEAEARRRMDLAAGLQPAEQGQATVVVPSGRGVRPVPATPPATDKPAPAGQKTKSGASSMAHALQWTTSAVSAGWAVLTERSRAGWSAINTYARHAAASVIAPGQRSGPRPAWLPWALGGGALAVAVAVVAAVVLRPRPAPAPVPVKTGAVMIDATPWATVTAIVAQDGTPQAVPPDAATPLSLQLPPGTYRVTLAGPLPDAPPQDVQVVVEDGRTSVAQEVRFTPLTAEAYFEAYLVSQPAEALTGAQAAGAQPARAEVR